jgi:hypothetical protein
LRFTAASHETYIASVTGRVNPVMRVALGGHIHCSVFRRFRKDPPKLDDLARKLGPEYAGLIPIVKRHVAQEYRLMIAHKCGHAGRKFIHLSMKSDSRLMSLVLVRKLDGESFDREQLRAALLQSGLPFYTAGVQRFKIASFESREHLVYLVSDLDQKQNTSMLLAMAPEVSEFLEKMEI